MDGRAPTLGLLADLGVEARPDHLLAGDDGTRRGVAAWRCSGVGGRLGKDDWEAADGWRGGGGENHGVEADVWPRLRHHGDPARLGALGAPAGWTPVLARKTKTKLGLSSVGGRPQA